MAVVEHPIRPFKLRLRARDPVRQVFFSLARKPLERVLGFSALNTIYAQIAACQKDDRQFPDKVLAALNVRYEVDPADVARIPRTGPVVLVANHPFGAIEGVILAALLQRVRGDVKIMANYLLGCIPELRDTMIFVDPFGGQGAAAANLKGLKATLQWVNQGGALAIFPAGTVSHRTWHSRRVMDPEWSQTVARIVRRTKAPVVPIFFDGANGPLFQMMGLVHPLLRTAMLPRELLKKRRSCIALRVGSPIGFAKLDAFPDDQQMTDYLRLRTYILAGRGHAEAQGHDPIPMQPIAAPAEPAALAREIQQLPPAQCLLESGAIQVFTAEAQQIPRGLQEIGRLRELTFRGAHEGSGKPLDLDVFDQHYLHLFLWNHAQRQIVGAYRIGKTEDILRRLGKEGLYTHTLFQYDEKFLRQIGPALELGRSFIRPECQKSYAPLMMLWKGIGRVIAQDPKYKMLFGPVSISAQYQSFSQQLMVAFLRHHTDVPGLSRLVAPRNPPRLGRRAALPTQGRWPQELSEVSDLVVEIENDQRDIPILLKQYYKLGAKFLGFNVDRAFSDVLDGLMLVDLTQAEPRIVERYLGKEPWAAFIAYHRAARN